MVSMKQVTEDRLELIRLSHPNVRIEHRDGKEVVIIPQYDIDTDRSWEITLELVRNSPGTGTTPDLNRPVRSGPIANFSKWLYGQTYERPDGQTFKVVPPPKDDDEPV